MYFVFQVLPESVDITQINSPEMVTDTNVNQPSTPKMKARKISARGEIIVSPEQTQKPKNTRILSSKATVLAPELSRQSKCKRMPSKVRIISPEEFEKLKDGRMQINEGIIMSPEQSQKPKNRRQHESKTFACSFCDYSTNRAFTLKEHTRCHTGERLSCSLCEKTFSSRSSLYSHRKHSHPNVSATSWQKSEVPQPRKRRVLQRKPKSVTVWLNKNLVHETRKRVRSIYDLLSPSTFSGEERFSCTTRKKKFDQRSQLVGHDVMVHNREKPVHLSKVYPRQKSENEFLFVPPILPAEEESSQASHSNGRSSDEENEPSANTLERQCDVSAGNESALKRPSSDFSRTNVKKRKLAVSPSELQAPAVLEVVQKGLPTPDASVAKMILPENDLESEVASLPEIDELARKLNSVRDVITSTDMWSCSVEVLRILEAPADVENQSTSVANPEIPLNQPKKCELLRKMNACSECEFSCVRKFDFKVHRMQHAGAKNVYSCLFCSRLFTSVMGLKYHQKRRHTPTMLFPIVLLNRIQ